MKQGKVWLVGAGPYDAGLLTVKGQRLLRMADVVVYDHLVGPGILAEIPPETRMIHVGKRAGLHPVPQERINRILLEEALAGNQVVRLKGGDPFLFGRGGEELELLLRHQIPFEVVPGVTSAIAVPAFGGIPVTHRGCSSSVHIITGHTKCGGSPQMDYQSLVRLGGTLVFLMGLGAVEELCAGLLEAGMSPETPAAMLENGTSAHQRRVVARLGELAVRVRQAGLVSPAILVVGEVCGFAQRFQWAEQRPLGGRRILVTRPRKRASALADRLSLLGAEVLPLPAIHTREIACNPALAQALHHPERYRWVVLTSPEGVEVLFRQMRGLGVDVRQLWGLKFAALGSATAGELEQRGIFPDYLPDQYSAEALGRGLAQRVAPGERLLLPRAQDGSPDLTAQLEAAGLVYDDIPIYQTRLQPQTGWQREWLSRNRADYITFTSASTVRGFAAMAEGLELGALHPVCIGAQTAREAERLFDRVTISPQATVESMVETLVQLERKRAGRCPEQQMIQHEG